MQRRRSRDEASEDRDEPAFFHALAAFKCKRNRLYRIYVLPDELIFIWAGSGSEGMAGLRKIGGRGIAHGLFAAAAGAALDPSKKNATRAEVLNQTPLDDLVYDDDRNMRANIDGLTELRIVQRSDRHARLYSDHGHQALMFVRHQQLGNYLLGIASIEDVQVAMETLPDVVGDAYSTEIDVPEEEVPCGCVFCR